MKTMELKTTGFVELTNAESIHTTGGITTFVYDLGSWIRAGIQASSHNYGGFATTVANWLSQQ